MSGIRSTFDHVVRTELAELPLPGRGDTWARFDASRGGLPWTFPSDAWSKVTPMRWRFLPKPVSNRPIPGRPTASGRLDHRAAGRQPDSSPMAGISQGKNRFVRAAASSSGRW